MSFCFGRAPHPLRLLAVAAEPAFADDVDVDALLGQKRFQFVDANVRRFFVRSEKKFPKKGSLEQIDSGTETAASSI